MADKPNDDDPNLKDDPNQDPDNNQNDDPGGQNDDEVTKAELKRARDEAAKSRVELQKLRKQIETEKSKDLQQQGKYKDLYEEKSKRVSDLEARYRQNAEDTALATELMKRGVVDVDAALKIVDRGTLVYDEETQEVSGADFIADLTLKSKPYLFEGKKAKTKPMQKPGADDDLGDDIESMSREERREYFRKKRESKRKHGGAHF